MKKLNLKDIKNGMSRNEMRSVKGAGCGGYCSQYREECNSYGIKKLNNSDGYNCC